MDKEDALFFGMLRDLLNLPGPILVVTGAGISKESGIPTFVDVARRWRGFDLSDLLTPQSFIRDPRSVWDWHLEVKALAAKAEPNHAHRRLAAWAKQRGDVTLVTQNIDGLHERAGHPDVLTLHGSLSRTRCTACDTFRFDDALEYPELPRCASCGTLERPDVVWFGESVEARAMQTAIRLLGTAKFLLLVGTSGMVAPASILPQLAQVRQVPVIDVNPVHSAVAHDFPVRLPASEGLELLLA